MNPSIDNSASRIDPMRHLADPPSVTVIIVNWNGLACLPRCLEALRSQTHGAFRVLVMDNGSTDGSAEMVERLGDARFTMVPLGANLGFARANNLAVAEATHAKWVALLNPDAFPEPDWLERLLAFAERHPMGAAFGSCLLMAQDPSVIDGSGDNYHVTGRAFSRDRGRSVRHLSRMSDEIFSPCAAAALYLRSAWLAVGGMDEDYFCYQEDVDLGFRLRLNGHECWHVADAVCRHMGSALTGKRSDFTTYHGQRNLVWTYVKNMPGALFWLLWPGHLLLNVVAVLFFTVKGQAAVVWRAKRDALLALPHVWRKRRAIQGRRSASLSAIWRWLDKSWLPR